jgi:hypothetical protein
MSPNRQSDVEDHLLRRTKENLLPFRTANHSDTGSSENGRNRKTVNALGAGADSGRRPSSANASITPIVFPSNSGGTVGISILRKLKT